MRLSDFWFRMEGHFGAVYARSVAMDYRVPALSMTVNEALESGVSPQRVWREVCKEFDVPALLR